MTATPTRDFVNANCWVGSWNNVAFQLWSGTITIVEIAQADATVDALLKRYPKGVSTLAVITTNTLPRLGEEERRRIDGINTKLKGRILANVQVAEGTGFGASAVRAILAGINLLNPTVGRVFKDLPSAAKEVASARGSDFDAQTLVGAVEHARRDWAENR